MARKAKDAGPALPYSREELMDQSVIKLAADALPAYKDIFPLNCAAALLVDGGQGLLDIEPSPFLQ